MARNIPYDWICFGYGWKVVKETEKAMLFIHKDTKEKVWIPLVSIIFMDYHFGYTKYGVLFVREWILKKKPFLRKYVVPPDRVHEEIKKLENEWKEVS